MGIHSSPTCELNFGSHDDCIGYLCGQENMGLAHMFQMMNSARINTGLSGMTIGSVAFQNALSYAKERLQGSDITREKDGRVRIIEHPDVRRMLMWMKANVDGMRSMIYTGAYWLDLASESRDQEKKAYYQALVEFLTPIIKAYCSDAGFRVCETAIQCLGGYGFTKEYPLEQYMRDVKIMSLYEGTNGIQSIDLMGRKMRLNNGALFKAFLSELENFIRENHLHPTVGQEVKLFGKTVERLKEVAMAMAEMSKKDPLQWASHTYPALLCFGDVVLSWRLLDMAVIAQRKMDEAGKNPFYLGKVLQSTYFTDTTLPLTMARLETCMRTGREILEIPEEAF